MSASSDSGDTLSEVIIIPKVDDNFPKVDVENLNKLISNLTKYRDGMIQLSDDQNASLAKTRDPEFQAIVDSTKLLEQQSQEIETTLKDVQKNFAEIKHVSDLIEKYGQYTRFELMKIIHQNNQNAKGNLGIQLKKLTKLFKRTVMSEVDFEDRNLNGEKIEVWFDKLISREFDQFEFDWTMHKIDGKFKRWNQTEIYD